MDELTGLSEETRKLALERFRLLQPHLERDQPLRSVANAAGIPYRTAHRWVAQYRKFGLAALARKTRIDRGRRHAVSSKIKEVIEGLALQKPPLPVAALYRQVQRLALDIGETVPTYWTVWDIVRRLPADLVILAHEGTKAYSNTFELVHRREAERPNAIWQADHTPLDILLVRPDGQAAKPWLTTVIDDYSRAVVGFAAAATRAWDSNRDTSGTIGTRRTPSQFLSDPSSRSDPDRAHVRSLVSFRVDDLRSEAAHIQSIAHAQVIPKRLMPFGFKGTRHSSSVPVFHSLYPARV